MDSIGYFILQLNNNKESFITLLKGTGKDEYLWKSNPDKWCLLEILCHLIDEEKEDFRTRLKCVLDSPETAPPPIEPEVWVESRNYIRQDFDKKLEELINERQNSINWLNSLESPKWENTYHHPKFGLMSAHFYLSNWLAHDYLHLKQIVKLKYDYLHEISGEKLQYAGTWK